MTRQTQAPLDHLSLNATNRRARELARMVDDGYIDLNPPYQRGSVWSEDQRVALVRSWKSGVPIPAVIMNDRATHMWREANNGEDVRAMSAVYVIVDGKQRIECAMAWFAGEFAVPVSWFEADEVESTIDTADGPYVTYAGLNRTGRLHFDSDATIPVVEGKLPTVQAEAEVYLLVNGGGTPQTAADMAKASRIADTEES